MWRPVVVRSWPEEVLSLRVWDPADHSQSGPQASVSVVASQAKWEPTIRSSKPGWAVDMNVVGRILYRAPAAPHLSAALLLLAILAGIFGLTLSVIDRGPWEFMVLWLAVMAAVAFGLLIFTCYEVYIQSGKITWRSALRHGTLPMDQLDRITAWPGGSIHVFE